MTSEVGYIRDTAGLTLKVAVLHTAECSAHRVSAQDVDNGAVRILCSTCRAGVVVTPADEGGTR